MKNPSLVPCLVSCAAMLLLFGSLSQSSAAPRTTGDVLITNSGDGSLPGYQVTVEPNGHLTAVTLPRRGQKPVRRTDRMISLNERRFFEDLSKAEPLERLPTGSVQNSGRTRGRRGRRTQQAATPNAPQSGPQVFVRYQGRQSPNLRTATSTEGRVLYQDVKQILQVLRLPIPNTP